MYIFVGALFGALAGKLYEMAITQQVKQPQKELSVKEPKPKPETGGQKDVEQKESLVSGDQPRDHSNNQQSASTEGRDKGVEDEQKDLDG